MVYPSLQHRRHPTGVSILEVLFAILITSIGLMGAIAIFPAAMLQAKRGMQADAVSIAGLKNIHAFDAEGMRKPNRWLLPSTTRPTGPWPGGAANPNPPQVPPPDGQFAFCIDPRFVAANASDPTPINVTHFPYGATGSPIVRVTLNNGVPGSTTAMTALHAELAFRIEDDIAYDRFRDGLGVRDNTLPAASQFVGGYASPQKRETQGHMSWMATLAPKIERLPTGSPLEDRYVLSVVVFYDRPTELQAGGANPFPPTEWSVAVNLDGGGVGGGEVTIQGTTAEEVDVRRDQWIMLLAQTNRNNHRMPICRWYRVIDADEPVQSGSNYTNTLSLAGGDFTDAYDPNPGIRAIICKGVVAVFEKTIKLEPGS